MTFARFMELALYCPKYGYYEREEDIIGRRGDFYTSVSVGSLFGELLAFQFAEWFEGNEKASASGRVRVKEEKLRIVEVGAHGGDLAKDILAWMREYRPDVFYRLEYCIVEPSAARRRWQRRNLAEFSDKVRWAEALAAAADPALAGQPALPPGLRGIVFANELLDALPVHRLGWDVKARAWFEWGVTFDAGRFAWTRIPLQGVSRQPQEPGTALGISQGQLALDSQLLDVLPDGFTVEVCPAAQQWWQTVAKTLTWGKLVALDYGLTAEEYFVPERKDGTLRAYRSHRLSNDVLACPGDQDLTAHVNFTAIRAAGEAAGLKTEAFQAQAQFLTGIIAGAAKDQRIFGEWTPERIRQFRTLTHPELLGRAFRVLVQSRDDAR